MRTLFIAAAMAFGFIQSASADLLISPPKKDSYSVGRGVVTGSGTQRGAYQEVLETIKNLTSFKTTPSAVNGPTVHSACGIEIYELGNGVDSWQPALLQFKMPLKKSDLLDESNDPHFTYIMFKGPVATCLTRGMRDSGLTPIHSSTGTFYEGTFLTCGENEKHFGTKAVSCQIQMKTR